MKPNDQAYQAALRATSDSCSAYQIQNALDAAYAAQFQSEDYAGLLKMLRSMHKQITSAIKQDDPWGIIDETVPSKAADALEAVLAERDTYKNWLDNYEKQFAAKIEELVTVRLERDALLARLAPVDDKALEAKAAAAIIAVEHNGIDDEFILEARATIAAIRPHIEAAERERCAKAVEKVAGRINVPLYERPAYEDGYLQGVHDAAAAIRSGK